MTSYVYAYGGNGGANGGSGAVDGASGSASATSNATGTHITSAAYAYGGASHTGDGKATALASGNGADGTVHAGAYCNYYNVANGMLVTYTNAIADATVSGASTAKTQAGIGATSAAFSTGAQAIAQIMGVPTAADVTSVLSANSNISAAFAAKTNPDYFAIGELGGAYSTNDTDPETETSSIHMGVDLTKITPKDLILGLYNGTATGAGFTSMTFDVKANGTDILNKTFTSVSAATTYFTNDALDLGALSGYGSTLTLDISLSITEAQAGGFDFGLLVGDPPPASHASSFALANDLLGAPQPGANTSFAQAATNEPRYLLASNPV